MCLCMPLSLCVYVCVCVCVRTCMYVLCVCMCVRVCVCVCACLYVRVRAFVCMCMRAHTHITQRHRYRHTHTHRHTNRFISRLLPDNQMKRHIYICYVVRRCLRSKPSDLVTANVHMLNKMKCLHIHRDTFVQQYVHNGILTDVNVLHLTRLPYLNKGTILGFN